ncbi:MAG: hypothetical protein F9K42_02660, partial [Ignavibacterium sp.]
MSDEIIRKYKLFDLLELQTTSVALADNTFKIFWYNKSFKKDIGPGKLKGISLKSLFGINTPDNPAIINAPKSFVVPVADKNKNIVITPIIADSKKKNTAYLIEILPIFDSEFKQDSDKEKFRRNLFFQRELQSLLVLLVKEKSIDTIAVEILLRCLEITNSGFGIIVLQDGNDIVKFIYNDEFNFISDKAEVEKSIKYNSSFINKWLDINKRPLLALNHHNNIGYGITQVLGCES